MNDPGNAEIYDRLSAVLEPIHDALVQGLAPRPAERWLDLGTATGTIARAAATAGANVSALDGSEAMILMAREEAELAGLTIGFDVGDVEYLPYDDREFDVISSNFGFIFAPDHANVAGELARVAKRGARLGFTAWKPNPKLGELYRRFTDEPLEGRESTEWGREDHVEDMLGEDFELEFRDGTLLIDASSGEELWEFFSTSAPPMLALLHKLEPEKAEAFHKGFVDLYESYGAEGRIHVPRRYLITFGTRR